MWRLLADVASVAFAIGLHADLSSRIQPGDVQHLNIQPTPRSRRVLQRLAFVAGSLWCVLLISCVALKPRTMFAPPAVPGAEFVSSAECTQCHANITRDFHDATHARLLASGPNAKQVGCEACHGPASKHVQSGGARDTIVNPRRSPEACFNCHADKRGEFALPHGHAVAQGKMSCTDCHEPHRGDTVKGGGTQLAGMNETCLKCHQAQRGPFVFQHEAVTEGCVTCHNPHGSVNEKMLKVPNQALCLQCHAQVQTAAGQILIGGVNHRTNLTRGTCWTAGCHEAVHGSHANTSLRF